MATVATARSMFSAVVGKRGGSTCYSLSGSKNLSNSSILSAAGSSSSSSGSSKSGSKQPTAADVVVSKVRDPPNHVFKKVEGPVGPGASKSGGYKNPEYFSYHELSYTDMDVVMAKYRLPQPSSKSK